VLASVTGPTGTLALDGREDFARARRAQYRALRQLDAIPMGIL
jgi:hypothetical protein